MDRKERAAFTIVSAALFLAFIVSLGVGKYAITLGDVMRILTGGEVKNLTRSVFLNLRFPRTLMTVLAGAGLGLAGSVYQSVFRNPLAAPDIVGISSGANLGAAVVIVLLGQSTATTTLGSFVGGLSAVAFVMLLVRATDSKSTSTYVLSGIIISSIAQAFIMLLKYYADSESQLAAIEYWTMGSFAAITSAKMMGVLPYWVIGFIGTLLLHRQIGLLSLNEDESRALGVRLREVRLLVLCFSTLLVASIVSVTGLISFAGLIAPHIAKMMTKRENSRTMVLSSLTGAFIILSADILARSLGPAEIPISILTTFIGVPVLVYFMYKRRGGRV